MPIKPDAQLGDYDTYAAAKKTPCGSFVSVSKSQGNHTVETLDKKHSLILSNTTNQLTYNGKPLEMPELAQEVRAAFKAAFDKNNPDMSPAFNILQKFQSPDEKKNGCYRS